MMIRKLFLAIAAVATLCGFQACGGDDDDIKVDDLYKQALQTTLPTLQNVHWEKKGAYKVAEGREGQYDVDVWFDNDARWVMTEYDYVRDTAKLPAAILQGIQAGEFAGWQIDDIELYRRPDLNFFVIEVESPGRNDVYLYYTESGYFIQSTSVDTDITPDTKLMLRDY